MSVKYAKTPPTEANIKGHILESARCNSDPTCGKYAGQKKCFTGVSRSQIHAIYGLPVIFLC